MALYNYFARLYNSRKKNLSMKPKRVLIYYFHSKKINSEVGCILHTLTLLFVLLKSQHFTVTYMIPTIYLQGEHSLHSYHADVSLQKDVGTTLLTFYSKILRLYKPITNISYQTFTLLKYDIHFCCVQTTTQLFFCSNEIHIFRIIAFRTQYFCDDTDVPDNKSLVSHVSVDEKIMTRHIFS